MKMTNREILEAVDGLGTILQDSVSIPASISYAIVRNFKMLFPISEDIYNERKKIIERYGEKTEDDYYKIPEEKMDAANQELNDLLNVNTSVPLVTFTLDNLSGYDIPIKTMNILYFMVQDGEV